jgi:hypothetical protein
MAGKDCHRLNFLMASSVTEVKKVTRLPSGSRNNGGAVAPRHCGRLLNPVVDDGLEPLVLAVDVVNLEFDDDGVIIGWESGIFAEQFGRSACGRSPG